MEVKQLETLFKDCPFPITWHHFRTEKDPPFVVWKENSSNHITSDQRVVACKDSYQVDLYYEKWEEKKAFETFLFNLPIPWQRVISDVWIEKEKMFLSSYDLEDAYGYYD